MSWTVQTNPGYQFHAGDSIRVAFTFGGVLLFDDVRAPISEKTQIQATDVERNWMLIPLAVIGTCKANITAGEAVSSVEAALNEWSTWNVKVHAIGSYVFVPGEVSTQQAISLASIALILLVAAAAFVYFKRGGKIV